MSAILSDVYSMLNVAPLLDKKVADLSDIPKIETSALLGILNLVVCDHIHLDGVQACIWGLREMEREFPDAICYISESALPSEPMRNAYRSFLQSPVPEVMDDPKEAIRFFLQRSFAYLDLATELDMCLRTHQGYHRSAARHCRQFFRETVHPA